MNQKLLKLLIGSLFVFGSAQAQATVFYADNFDALSDGPLDGQGDWTRAPGSVSPNAFPVISGGAVAFEWNDVNDNDPHAVNARGDTLDTGMLFASFTMNVSRAPSAAVVDIDYPGFFSFRNPDGNASRGRIGINPGSTAGTFTLGVSSGSQSQGSYSFSSLDLSPNITYTVVLGYNIDTTGASLWVNPANQSASPVATIEGSNSTQGIRRVVLDIRNRTDRLDDLGAFTLDNLIVATTLGEVGVAAVPEPATVSLLSGLFLLGFVAVRKRIRK